jgi:hypothetical protein
MIVLLRITVYRTSNGYVKMNKIRLACSFRYYDGPNEYKKKKINKPENKLKPHGTVR